MIFRGKFACFLMILGAVSLAEELKPVQRTGMDIFLRRQTEFAEKNTQRRGVFLGDSLTEYWMNYPNNTVHPGGMDAWKKYFVNFGNFGMAGDSMENILWRVSEGKLLDHCRFNVVVLQAGSAELQKGTDPERIVSGMESIVAQIRSRQPDAAVLLLNPPPMSFDGGAKDANSRKLPERMKKLADGKNIFFLDISSLFLSEKGFVKNLADGVNPDPDGYAAIAKMIAPEIDKLDEEVSMREKVPPLRSAKPESGFIFYNNAKRLADGPSAKKILFFGGSVTYLFKAPAGGLNEWNAIFPEAHNAGVAGARAPELLWCVRDGQILDKGKYPVIVFETANYDLLSGENGRSAYAVTQDYLTILAALKEKQPEAKIFLLPPNPYNLFAKRMAELLKKADDGKQVFFIDTAAVFSDKDGTPRNLNGFSLEKGAYKELFELIDRTIKEKTLVPENSGEPK